MQKKLDEISKILGGKLSGDGDHPIFGVAPFDQAGAHEITFAVGPRYIKDLKRSKAGAVILAPEVKPPAGINTITVENPSLAFTRVVEMFKPSPTTSKSGIDPTASISQNVTLGKDIFIGPYTVIADGAQIADGTIIHALSYIGQNSKIGTDCTIYPHVTIREGSIIGNHVIIHSGTIIGSDGFGYFTIDGRHTKIPQSGIVEIEDDVEIGANVTIDRARFDKTLVAKGTKIDNLVMIAHNVKVGQNNLIIAQVGISGSTEIGNNVILAGQVGVVGHIRIGDHCIATAKSGVTKSLKPGQVVSGIPSRPHHIEQRAKAHLYRLPDLMKRVAELEKRIDELEERKISHDK